MKFIAYNFLNRNFKIQAQFTQVASESSCQSITLFGVNFGHGLVSWGHDKVLLTAYKLTAVLVTILKLWGSMVDTRYCGMRAWDHFVEH